jgi:hypothetical protein
MLPLNLAFRPASEAHIAESSYIKAIIWAYSTEQIGAMPEMASRLITITSSTVYGRNVMGFRIFSSWSLQENYV